MSKYIYPKSTLAVVLLLLSGPAFTQGTYGAWQGNGVLGMTGTLAERKAHLDVGLNYTSIPGLPPTEFSHEHTDRGYVGEFLVGYQLQKKGWLVGLELNVSWQDIANEQLFAFTDIFGLIGWAASAHYEEKPRLGLTGRVGYAVTSYLIPYIRLGTQLSKDRLEMFFTADPLVLSTTLAAQQTQWHYHFIGGFGFEVPLPACWALRVEYDYQCYLGKSGISVNAAGLSDGFNSAVVIETRPRTQAGKVSLVWNFG